MTAEQFRWELAEFIGDRLEAMEPAERDRSMDLLDGIGIKVHLEVWKAGPNVPGFLTLPVSTSVRYVEIPFLE